MDDMEVMNRFQDDRMHYGRPQAEEAAAFVQRAIGGRPVAGILAGTGLGAVTEAGRVEAALGYAEIPHFPVSTVPSHHSRLVLARMAGRPVAVLQGRMHLYEGYSPLAVTFPVRVLQALGVTTLVLTNASGGLNPTLPCGGIMIIADHLNLTGANPLAGPNDGQWGPRFPDMTGAYDRGLRARAAAAAGRLGIAAHTGVYAGLRGPSLETPAEMRWLRAAGADAVGFSTVMETIAAVHAGMRVLGLSTITNLCRPDAAEPAAVEEIIRVAEEAAPKVGRLIEAVLAEE